MGGPGLEGSLQLWLLPSCKGPGSQSLPDTLTPFTAPFTSSRLASLVPTYSLVPSQLFQGASLMRQLFSFLISSRETWASCPTNVPLPPGLPPPPQTHTLSLFQVQPPLFACYQSDSLPPSFLHVNSSSTTSSFHSSNIGCQAQGPGMPPYPRSFSKPCYGPRESGEGRSCIPRTDGETEALSQEGACPRPHRSLAGGTGSQPGLLCGQRTPVSPASLSAVKAR